MVKDQSMLPQEANSVNSINLKMNSSDFQEGSPQQDVSQFPCLEMQIYHSDLTHQPQKSTDEVIYQLKLPGDEITTLDDEKLNELCGTEETALEETDGKIYEDGNKTVSIKKSMIDKYRSMSNYYGPLRIVSEVTKMCEDGEMKQVVQAKLQHVEIQATDKDGNKVDDKNEMRILMSQTPGIIPACDSKGENSQNDCSIALVLGEGESYNVSKKAVFAFKKLARVEPPFNTKVQKIVTQKDENVAAVSVLTLYPRVDSIAYSAILQDISNKPEKEETLNEEEPADFNNCYRRDYINWSRRGNSAFKEIRKIGIDFLNEVIVEKFIVEDSLSNLGRSTLADFAQEMPNNVVESSQEEDAINGLESVEELWNHLISLVRNDQYLIEFEFEMDDEKWIEVKRAFNMFQIDGEVVPDIVLRIVYRKKNKSDLCYYIRCIGRLIKTGSLLSIKDISDILTCLARDRYICLGLSKSTFLHRADQNELLSSYLEENVNLCSVPFEALYSKKCKAIVSKETILENSRVKRGDIEINGPSILCGSCLSLQKKLTNLLEHSVKTTGSQELPYVPNKPRYGPINDVKISENIKCLFMQTPSQFIASSKRKHLNVSDVGMEEGADRLSKQSKSNSRIEGSLNYIDPPPVNVTEEKFENMISIEKYSKYGSVMLHKQCKVCGFEANNMLSLFSHMSGHLGILSEECDDCHVKFSNVSALLDHRTKCSDSERDLKCPDCSMRFTQHEMLYEHYNVHRTTKPFNCRVCEAAFQVINDYKKHLRLFHKLDTVRDLNFVCSVCDSYFYTKDHLLIHQLNKNHNQDQNVLICKICKFSSHFPPAFFTHLLCHSYEERENNNLATCFDCNKVFFSNFRLEDHRKSKHNSQFIKSNIAPTQDTSLFVKKEPIELSASNTCLHCFKVFSSSNALQRHISIYHMNSEELTASYNSIVSCKVCNRQFTGIHLLASHMKLHNSNRPVFQCEECGFVYNKRSQVLAHIRKDHADAVQRHQQLQQQQEQVINDSSELYDTSSLDIVDHEQQIVTVQNGSGGIEESHHSDEWNAIRIQTNVDNNTEERYEFTNFNSQFI